MPKKKNFFSQKHSILTLVLIIVFSFSLFYTEDLLLKQLPVVVKLVIHLTFAIRVIVQMVLARRTAPLRVDQIRPV